MPPASLFRYCYLAYLSQPRADRAIYRALRSAKVSKIVELGLGTGLRTRRLLEVAKRFQRQSPIRYTGIDLFEARSTDLPGLTLRRAHKTLADCGARIQLVPGDPLSALSRAANSLTKTDLVIISVDQDRASLAKAWFYVPRMLHAGSLVFLEEAAGDGQAAFRLVSVEEVAALAAAATVRHLKRAA